MVSYSEFCKIMNDKEFIKEYGNYLDALWQEYILFGYSLDGYSQIMIIRDVSNADWFEPNNFKVTIMEDVTFSWDAVKEEWIKKLKI